MADRFLQVVADSFGVAVEGLSDRTTVGDVEPDVDELDFVELCLDVEEEFGVEIDDDSVRASMTLGELRKMAGIPTDTTAGWTPARRAG